MKKKDKVTKKRQKIENRKFNRSIYLTAPFKGRSRRLTAFKRSLRRCIKYRLKQLDREINHSEK